MPGRELAHIIENWDDMRDDPKKLGGIRNEILEIVRNKEDR